jgi:hypothetical protein
MPNWVVCTNGFARFSKEILEAHDTLSLPHRLHHDQHPTFHSQSLGSEIDTQAEEIRMAIAHDNTQPPRSPQFRVLAIRAIRAKRIFPQPQAHQRLDRPYIKSEPPALLVHLQVALVLWSGLPP